MAISHLTGDWHNFEANNEELKWINVGHIQPGEFSIGEEKPSVHVPTLTVTEDFQNDCKKFELSLSDIKIVTAMSHNLMAQMTEDKIKDLVHRNFINHIEYDEKLSDEEKAKYKEEIESFYKPKATGGLVIGSSIMVGNGEVYIWPSGVFKTGHVFLGASQSSVSSKSKKLPGMDHKVVCPALGASLGDMYGLKGEKTAILCTDEKPSSLWNQVQHLNDEHEWPREKIADWLDELHDSGEVNLEFEPWEEENV
jgi:hypothetical protein